MRVVQVSVGRKDAVLRGYLQEIIPDGGLLNIRPAVVICPGGGFDTRWWGEEDPAAQKFLARGYNVFILEYSIGEDACDMNPLIEISDALIKIRNHAKDWMCNPLKVSVLGFSAGAHVALSIALLHNRPELTAVTPVKDEMNRPDACILCYPLVTSGPLTHKSSMERLTKGDKDLLKLYALENHVSENAPPMFIWGCVDDPVIDISNSLMLAQRLKEKNVPFELHLFEQGGHGLSVADKTVGKDSLHVQHWVDLCLEWLG